MTTTISSTSQVQHRGVALLGMFGFAIALAAAAQVALPIPGTAVPFTLQPLVVVLAGLMLGPAYGAASMLVYLAAGAAGLPVFAPLGAPGIARFLGPTGGYLIAFPAAAFVAGYVSSRRTTLVGRWGAALLGMVVIFIGGIAQLAILSGGLGRAMALGVTPFAVLDIFKAFLAALIARPRIRSARD